MSDRKARLTITVDPHLTAYAEHLVETGKASSVSAVFNDAMEARIQRERRQRRLWKEAAERADPAKVARRMAHVDAQAAALPKRGARIAGPLRRLTSSTSASPWPSPASMPAS